MLVGGVVVDDRMEMLLQEGNGVHYNISGARQHLVVNTPSFLVLATGYFGAAHCGRGGQIYTFHH